MNKVVLLFPGQGSQHQGMANDLLNLKQNEAKINFVNNIFGLNIKDIFNSEKINDTKYSQICIFLHSVLLLENLDFTDNLSFGLSLGDFTSLYFQKQISFENAVILIKKRAELMANAFDSQEYSMMALRCKDHQELEKKLQNNDDIFIANYNTPNQVVISGKITALNEFNEKEKLRGILLNVSGAFHSLFLKNAATELEIFTKSIDCEIRNFNSSSQVTKINELLSTFVNKQMIGSVYFLQGIQKLIAENNTVFLEIGPNKVLSKLVKQINKDVQVQNIETIEDTINLKENING